jgi:hypothetical protein
MDRVRKRTEPRGTASERSTPAGQVTREISSEKEQVTPSLQGKIRKNRSLKSLAYQGKRKRNYSKEQKPAVTRSNSRTFGICNLINLVRRGLGKAVKEAGCKSRASARCLAHAHLRSRRFVQKVWIGVVPSITPKRTQ